MRPWVSASGPGREVVAGCEGLGGVEDRKRHGDHSEDYETAAEVYASENKLSYSDSGFGLLCSVGLLNHERGGEDDLTKSFACSFSVNFSYFSKVCSSRDIGLRRSSIVLPDIPTTFIAIFDGGPGVVGTSTGTPWLWREA